MDMQNHFCCMQCLKKCLSVGRVICLLVVKHAGVQAYRAHMERRHKDEAVYLLQAGCWAEAHAVIIIHLVSRAIVNGTHH
jgi:hypothetical protein